MSSSWTTIKPEQYGGVPLNTPLISGQSVSQSVTDYDYRIELYCHCSEMKMKLQFSQNVARNINININAWFNWKFQRLITEISQTKLGDAT